MFAVDSIPAIFAVTTDPFIVFTSNIFAILGLRSMYFLLAGVVERFRYLGVGLALVLVFVGGKMLASGVYEVPVAASLAVIAAILAVSIVASLVASGAPVREPSASAAAAAPDPATGPGGAERPHGTERAIRPAGVVAPAARPCQEGRACSASSAAPEP